VAMPPLGRRGLPSRWLNRPFQKPVHVVKSLSADGLGGWKNVGRQSQKFLLHRGGRRRPLSEAPWALRGLHLPLCPGVTSVPWRTTMFQSMEGPEESMPLKSWKANLTLGGPVLRLVGSGEARTQVNLGAFLASTRWRLWAHPMSGSIQTMQNMFGWPQEMATEETPTA